MKLAKEFKKADATADTIVDKPLLETYDKIFDRDRREDNILKLGSSYDYNKGSGMKTMAETIDLLHKLNFKHDFKISNNRLKCIETGEIFSPKDLLIEEIFRYEGDSNPDDMSILYAVSTASGTKGIIVDAYGTYANSELTEFMIQVN